MSDSDLAYLRSLDNLRVLHLRETAVTPEGVEWLQGVRSDCKIIIEFASSPEQAAMRKEKTRRQKEAVRKLEELGGRVVCVQEGPFSPTEPWRKVVAVCFQNPRLNDTDLEHVEGLRDLEVLRLSHTQITDAGLEHLAGLTNLRTLYLDLTQITDAGLRHLEGMAKLESLFLDDTEITDEGLEHLECLDNLQRLTLRETPVTPVGIQKLQQALPNCSIHAY